MVYPSTNEVLGVQDRPGGSGQVARNRTRATSAALLLLLPLCGDLFLEEWLGNQEKAAARFTFCFFQLTADLAGLRGARFPPAV